MNEDDDLVLNAKAIGLAIGGAALAGMLFVLTRRDDKPAPALETAAAEPVVDSFAEAARQAADEAKSHRQSVADAAREAGKSAKDAAASSRADIADLERDLKAAAWDAQERARLAESKLREVSGKVAEDASHLASRVGEEARHLAGEGKERLTHLRRPGGLASEAERLADELDARREDIAGKGKKGDKDRLGVKKKLAGKKVGPLPEGVAGEAASAALENLEKSLKTKAPLLLNARSKAQALEIAQRELGPILRDSAMLALSTALGSAERASQKAASAPADLKQRLRQEAESAGLGDDTNIEDKIRAAREAATAEILKARDDAEAEARAARAEADRLKEELAARLAEIKESAQADKGRDLLSEYAVEPVASDSDADGAAGAQPEGDTPHKSGGVSGLLWGGAGLGLAIYALMDPERRESILKMANEASVQMQELVRDLQGYDDEF